MTLVANLWRTDDYMEPPDPPLPPELAKWADDCLRKAGVIA